jgi:hypothetical protein
MSILPKNKFRLSKKNDYIKTTELAKFFSIEPRQLNQILTNMGWIEKKHYIWWIATSLGKENGAIEHNIKDSRVCYVYWNKEVMQNEELISTIKTTIRSYIENNIYEEYIKEQFIKQGYTVWHHSRDKTQENKNKNITLVAKKKKKILLIHCRDNQLDISTDELKSFQYQRDNFKVDNPVFKDYNLTLHYSMSGFFLTEEAYEYVEENCGDITYEVVKGASDNNWMDALLLKDTAA